MNILHVLTTGSSLLESITQRNDDDYRSLAGALIPGAAGPDTVSEILLDARATADTALDLDRLLRPEQQRTLAAASHLNAAEWASVHTVRRPDQGFPTSDRDSYVFLASDTDDGLRAAALLAVGHDPSLVHYLHEPLDHGDRNILPGEGWICRVPRLDLGDARRRPTPRTWRSLGAIGRLVARTAEQQPDDWTVVVHYSGGYKAIVPYAVVLAEAMRSRLRECTVPVRAVALHESSVRTETPVVVEVPVRAMSCDLWADVKELRAALRRDSAEVPPGTTERLSGLMLEPSANGRGSTVTDPGLISTHVL